MGKSSAPSAPDPYQAAGAQAQFGEQAALYNTALQRPNVETPYGSTTWTTNAPGGTPGTPPAGAAPGTATVGQGMPSYQPQAYGSPGFGGGFNPPGGGGGGPYGVNPAPPQYTEHQTLSPEQQALLEQRQGTSQQAGAGASAALGIPLPTVGENQDFGAQARQAAYGFDTSTLDPYWNEQHRQIDSSLRNAGATPGTPAYDNAMTQFNTQRDQAYSQARNQAFGQGLEAQGQQISQIGQLRDIPLSEYTALSGGSQPTAAGGTAAAGSTSAPDLMQAFQNQYQGQLAGYNANVASQNTDVGALSSLAAMLAMFYSDKRMKKDIKPLQAKTARGNPLYAYRYNFQSKDEPKQVGVMAQDVEKRNPEAVGKDAKGMRYVDLRRV